MALDQRGDISVAVIIVYIFVAIGAAILTFKYGFKREAGWVSLLIFSIIRIAGGVADVIAEDSNPPSSSAYTATFILQSAGAAPLLLATSAFLAIIVSITTSSEPIPFTSTKLFRLIRLAITIGLVLSIVGGVDSSSNSESDRNTGKTLRKAGALVLAGGFVATALQHLIVLSNKRKVLQHRWGLLTCCLFAQPFLFVRILYSVLSAFAPFPSFNSAGIIQSSGGLANFSSIAGKWQIYLVMSVLMEFFVVTIYIAGEFLLNKAQKDETDYNYAIPLESR